MLNYQRVIFPIIKDQFPTFPNQFKKRSWSIYKWSMFHSYVSLLQLFSSVPYGTNPFVLRGRAQLCTSLDSSRFSRPRQGTRLRLKAEETVFFGRFYESYLYMFCFRVFFFSCLGCLFMFELCWVGWNPNCISWNVSVHITVILYIYMYYMLHKRMIELLMCFHQLLPISSCKNHGELHWLVQPRSLALNQLLKAYLLPLPGQTHWIGLRENLNRKPWISPLSMGLSCNFSLKPIQWQTRSLSLHPDIHVEFLPDIKQWWILRLYAEKHLFSVFQSECFSSVKPTVLVWCLLLTYNPAICCQEVEPLVFGARRCTLITIVLM